MTKQITDIETWLLDNEGRIFRYVIYRRMFTPYEQKHAFNVRTVVTPRKTILPSLGLLENGITHNLKSGICGATLRQNC